MVKMLLNASRKSDELRLAVVDASNKLLTLDVESREHESTKGNIYFAEVIRVVKGLEAAFVHYGQERHGFLPFREISKEYYTNTEELDKDEKVTIDKVITPGQRIVVQVEKEERGAKGAALTTYLTLAGCYLVLMPNNPRSGGISRRIEGEERQEMKELLDKLNFPSQMGLIIRTAGLGRNLDELQWDIDVLLTQWQAIKDSVKQKSEPFLIFKEADVMLRAIRDHLKSDVETIIVDEKAAFEEISKYVKLFRPDFIDKIQLDETNTPLFSKYHIENKIKSAYQANIELNSGGSIVINHTEALTAIDINSAKSTKGSDIEDTALQTNLEAAEEIALQLRLRDVGGLVVIDFIDMSNNKNQRAVENALAKAVEIDRARIQLGKISRFGLLEMSRQRLKPSLGESDRIICHHCNGQGYIPSANATASSILREIEAYAAKQQHKQLQIHASFDVTTYLINEKRASIVEMENKYRIDIIIIPNPNLAALNYDIIPIDKSSADDEFVDSYTLIEADKKMKIDSREYHSRQPKQSQSAAIEHMSTITQAPTHVEKSTLAIMLKKVWASFVGKENKPKKKFQKKRYYKHRKFKKGYRPKNNPNNRTKKKDK